MKKFIYIILLVLSGSLAITSCTEVEVAPKTEAGIEGAGGGGATGNI